VLLSAPAEPGAEAGEVVLAELLALRSLFLNLSFRAGKEPLTEAEMRGLIERADSVKMQRARERLTAVRAEQKEQAKEILTAHRNAQRLLKPVFVANPYARELTFLESQTRTRRDHMKYLTLIRSIALLYQHQRPHKTTMHRGQTLEYIEVTKDDIAIANRLAHEVLGRWLDELPPQTRRLLLLVDEMVRQDSEQKKIERQDYRFSRKDVRAFSRWSDSQLKRHLHRLEELEYLVVHQGGRGQSMVYELVFERREDSARPALPGLIEIEKLSGCHYDEKKSGLESQRSGSSLAQVRGMSGSGADWKSPATTRAERDLYEDREKNTVWEQEQNPVLVVPPKRAVLHHTSKSGYRDAQQRGGVAGAKRIRR
jgi:hypothetical protein